MIMLLIPMLNHTLLQCCHIMLHFSYEYALSLNSSDSQHQVTMWSECL